MRIDTPIAVPTATEYADLPVYQVPSDEWFAAAPLGGWAGPSDPDDETAPMVRIWDWPTGAECGRWLLFFRSFGAYFRPNRPLVRCREWVRPEPEEPDDDDA